MDDPAADSVCCSRFALVTAIPPDTELSTASEFTSVVNGTSSSAVNSYL